MRDGDPRVGTRPSNTTCPREQRGQTSPVGSQVPSHRGRAHPGGGPTRPPVYGIHRAPFLVTDAFPTGTQWVLGHPTPACRAPKSPAAPTPARSRSPGRRGDVPRDLSNFPGELPAGAPGAGIEPSPVGPGKGPRTPPGLSNRPRAPLSPFPVRLSSSGAPTPPSSSRPGYRQCCRYTAPGGHPPPPRCTDRPVAVGGGRVTPAVT